MILNDIDILERKVTQPSFIQELINNSFNLMIDFVQCVVIIFYIIVVDTKWIYFILLFRLF